MPLVADSKLIPPHILKLMSSEARALYQSVSPANEAPEVFEERCASLAEKELQKQIAGYLATREIFFGQQRMDRKSTMVLGWPDFVFPFHGKFVALEAKTGQGRQSPEQEEAQRQIIAQGGYYFVVRSIAEVQSILNALST